MAAFNVVPDLNASKGRGRQKETNRIYAHSLPIVFSPPDPPQSWVSYVGLFPFRHTQVEIPQCEGFFDANTRSVWVLNFGHSTILWQRGFFGKGNLSRSEPSWLVRRIHDQQQKAKKAMTSEEITAKRRSERKQFKLDRAQAFAASVAEAEAAFAAGDTTVKVVPLTREAVASFAARASDRSETQSPEIPHADSGTSPDVMIPDKVDAAEVELHEEDVPENLEHLQLTLQESFFLLWSLDCLRVFDPNTREVMTLSEIWTSFQRTHSTLPPTVSQPPRFDNPFLVNYVIYHHYRSLGWVVRSGIKFCVDYLLYKRGPVFHHAEFAITLCPVYEDLKDQADSPFDLANTTPFSWSWLSTINRVNTQVQKTLILTYVTIPSSRRVSTALLSSPACLAHYSVREVVVRRFVPARMRD